MWVRGEGQTAKDSNVLEANSEAPANAMNHATSEIYHAGGDESAGYTEGWHAGTLAAERCVGIRWQRHHNPRARQRPND